MQRKKRTKASRGWVAEHLNRPYSRILIPQEDGRFSAEILEFPGCFAEGEDPQSTYANLEGAAASWLAACLASGTPIPPPLTNYEVSGKFALRLPKGLYLRAAKAAAKEAVSLNQYITTAIAEKLGAHGVTQKLEDLLSEIRRLSQVVQIGILHQFADTTVREVHGIPARIPINDLAANTGRTFH